MELFAIERYEGDSYAVQNNAEKESENLAQLLEQARGRKRSKQSTNSKQDGESTVDENKEEIEPVLEVLPRVKKKKKYKKKKDDRLKRSKLAEHEDIKLPVDESVENGEEDDITKILEGEKMSSKEGANNDSLEVSMLISHEDTNYLDMPNEGVLKSQIEMTVIGGANKKQNVEAVRRTKWLANPSFFSSDVNKNLLTITEMKGLNSDMVQKLQKQGVEHFFPVQKSVIPAVLSSWEEKSSFGRGGFFPQDICVCAPTGSGKTLAYVLPVIELLRHHTLRSLEALVIVPTKDLATQVWNVFNIYVEGTGLNVGVANGLKSLQKEKKQLGSNSSLGYSSNVNILVATPGRLVEHISNTEGFSLQFLRFFIIDEADRLLAEPYFGWLGKVFGSVYPFAESEETCRRSPLNMLTPLKTEKLQRPLQKLLFSATLTQNPEKLALLQLYKPRFFAVSKYENTEEASKEESETFGTGTLLRTPVTLEESMYICNSGGKPLVLLHLLTAQGLNGVLCFTSSVESTHRLYLLLKHFGGIEVKEFSSNLSAGRRQTILNDFKCGQTQIIICSDAMARGLDVPAVKYVISYDPPVSSKTYVHRVGRTARAGKTGTAITLLHDNEVFHFKKMLKSLKKGKISKHSIKDSDLECLMKKYEAALEQLQTEVTSLKKQTKRMRR